MRIAVLGLWHLGSVTAACLAQAGHEVCAWDPSPDVVAAFRDGRVPVAEPGLVALVAGELAAGRLRCADDLGRAVAEADVVWVTFDTPVDAEDRADVEYVLDQMKRAVACVQDDPLMIVSSQLPVGSVRRMEEWARRERGGRPIRVACVPENLRLGRAIERFVSPDRVVAGTRDERDRGVIAELFAPLTDRIVWMSVESAEMTKHAINAFLATSVAFINEVASIGESVGADAKEVERGLKTDQRIGPSAYLSPGGPFAGGTLARDLAFLGDLAARAQVPAPLIDGVGQSNREHAGWVERTLAAVWRSVPGRTAAIWGLTYKPGTDTLRRSASVEIADRLLANGVIVRAFDPAIRELPSGVATGLCLAESALAAAAGADVVIIGTEWPAFRDIDVDTLVQVTPAPLVLDPSRFLATTLGRDPRVRYLAVGTPRP